jgi:hypothetical protein
MTMLLLMMGVAVAVSIPFVVLAALTRAFSGGDSKGCEVGRSPRRNHPAGARCWPRPWSSQAEAGAVVASGLGRRDDTTESEGRARIPEGRTMTTVVWLIFGSLVALNVLARGRAGRVIDRCAGRGP